MIGALPVPLINQSVGKKNHFVFNSHYFPIIIVKTERNNVIRSATLYHNSQP